MAAAYEAQASLLRRRLTALTRDAELAGYVVQEALRKLHVTIVVIWSGTSAVHSRYARSTWAGLDRGEGEAVIARLQAVRWVTFQSAFDAAMPRGVRAYWRNAWFSGLGDSLIDVLIEHAGAQSWLGTGTDLHQMGGLFGRVAEDATAFPSRAAEFWLNIYGFWRDPEHYPARTAWVKEFSEALRPHAAAGQYLNFQSGEGADPAQGTLAVFGASKFGRLQAVKRAYDPDNVFRINHNIPPSPG